MHKIFKTQIVPYSQEKMYYLVNNIKDYPLFLNWCEKSKIIMQSDVQIIASLSINKSKFRQTFTTINNLEKYQKITMNLKDGPFKTLFGEWSFNKINDSKCKVSLKLTFSFNNKLMDFTIAPVFSQIANSQLDAFINRAKELYG